MIEEVGKRQVFKVVENLLHVLKLMQKLGNKNRSLNSFVII